jgi:hypothetical protein
VFQTTTAGLDAGSFPMRLYEKAATSQFQKRLARIERARRHGLGSIELDELEA